MQKKYLIYIFSISFFTFHSLLAWASESTTNRDPSSIVNTGGGGESDNEELISEDLGPDKKTKESIRIPTEINNRVSSWIHYYTERERSMTIRYFQRGSAYKQQIEKMLEQSDVPKELYYLAMIESGFVPKARSHAHAVGIWQLIPGTAKNYGLKINRFVDERRHWIKSTEAAITYLKDLRNIFGSWYLAMAAYNAGEYGVVRSIIRGKSRDFWLLAESKKLPKETLDYVPKFIAAMIIGEHLDKYGIEFIPEKPWEDFEVVEAPSGATLAKLAKITNIPVDIYREWNPDLLRGTIPPARKGKFEIYLPKTVVSQYREKNDVIAKLINNKYRDIAMNENQGDFSIYVVRPGDTLTSISRTIGISVKTIKRMNNLKKGKIHPGQRIRYYNNVASITKDKNKKSRLPASKNKSRASNNEL